MQNTNPHVDDYLQNAPQWREEMQTLRRIVLGCGLAEEWKWRAPCYTHQDSNVSMIGALKESCVLSFFKGALLKDPAGILLKPGENTQAARVIRFTSVREITKLKSVLEAYLQEAMAVEEAGLKVALSKNAELDLPAELRTKFADNPALEAAFNALTPGRQRAYVIYFTAPKQSSTRTTRIEKYTPRILSGKGFNDCVCGLSKKLPGCDGSHNSVR